MNCMTHVWHLTGGDLPQLRDDELIYALGRYGDVFGPLPFEMFERAAWAGNMFHASHDLTAFAFCEQSWREAIPHVADAIADQSPKGRDAQRLDAKHASGGAEGNRPEHSRGPVT